MRIFCTMFFNFFWISIFNSFNAFSSYNRYKFIILSCFDSLFCPRLHTKTVIHKYLSCCQLFHIFRLQFEIMWFYAIWYNSRYLYLVTTNSLCKLSHCIKTCYHLDFFTCLFLLCIRCIIATTCK